MQRGSPRTPMPPLVPTDASSRSRPPARPNIQGQPSLPDGAQRKVMPSRET
jgi:hypothetical protein